MDSKRLRRQYNRIYNSLGRAELQQGTTELTAADISSLFDKSGDGLWLGFYTMEGVNVALERYGLFDELRALGYEDLGVVLKLDDPEEQLLRVVSKSPRFEEPLIELVARRSHITLTDELEHRLGSKSLQVLYVEWLQLQNPLADFQTERAPLPGQHLPGLGIAKNVFEILRNVCRRLNITALATIPSFAHNAILYSGGFRYMDPIYQGKLTALERDLTTQLGRDLPAISEDQQLAALSWAVLWKLVVEHLEDEEAPFDWFHEPMLTGLTPELHAYFESEWYGREAHESSQTTYALMPRPLEETMRSKGIIPLDIDLIDEWVQD